MQQIPDDVTPADVWQWLNHGWFWYDDGEIRVPATIEDRDEEDLRVYPLGLDSVQFDRTTCFPHWPECGALNMNGYAVYLHRNPARQYRDGRAGTPKKHHDRPRPHRRAYQPGQRPLLQPGHAGQYRRRLYQYRAAPVRWRPALVRKAQPPISKVKNH